MDRISPRRLALVIDDDADTREVYALVLALEGCLVAQARDGQEGLQQARVLVPDIIITDLTMPIMDGWETIRRLRGTHARGISPSSRAGDTMLGNGWTAPCRMGSSRSRVLCTCWSRR
jgi:CheY-like chemotaxis protein